MKKTIVLMAVVAAALFFTGCVSVNTSDGANQIPQVAANHPGYTAKFAHKNTRVNGFAQINVLFNFFAWGADGFADNSQLSFLSLLSIVPSPDNFAKSAAVYNACQTNKADILVGTRYKLTTTDYWVFKTVKCEVAGFPATMTDVAVKKPYAIGNKLYWLSEKPVAVK